MYKLFPIRCAACLFFMISANLAHAALYVPNSFQPRQLQDGKLHLFICGTGTPQAAMQVIRKPACIVLAYQNHLQFIDTGVGAIETAAALGLPITQLQTIFITHLHSDHMGGLGEALNTSWYSGRNFPVTVYGPYGIKHVVKGFEKAYQNDVLFRAIGASGILNPNLASATTVTLDTVNTESTLFTQQDLSISAFPVNHLPVFPAYGYRLHFKQCNIIVSGDTKVDEKLSQYSKDADLLINEAVSDPLYKENSALQVKANPERKAHVEQIFSYHSSTVALAKMAATNNIKQLVLTHLLPSIPINLEEKKAFIAGMSQDYKGPITVADDMDEIIIDSDATNGCQITYLSNQAVNKSATKIQ